MNIFHGDFVLCTLVYESLFHVKKNFLIKFIPKLFVKSVRNFGVLLIMNYYFFFFLVGYYVHM
jgi:hypothetical protein